MFNSNFKVELSAKAEKDFASLDNVIQKHLFKKFSELENLENPLKYSAKLVGFKNYYRHRFGDYRIIFTTEKNGKIVILLILKIAHRKDIYKDLK